MPDQVVRVRFNHGQGAFVLQEGHGALYATVTTLCPVENITHAVQEPLKRDDALALYELLDKYLAETECEL